MKNIAVLYDIENLIGGYGLKYLSEISLKSILKEFHKNGYKNIAVQKAYADWSNTKLNEIKWDIAELGIEPIQMYGFSKGAVKNASDIQLVIDSMEILHTKPFIDTFVLVSGDGGFSSLAKKISEYGKKVIGCSFKDRANTIFTKVCDEFIFIDDTLSKTQLDKLKGISLDENKKKSIIESPILKDVLLDIEPIISMNLDEIQIVVNKFINELLKNQNASKILKTEGLNISVFKSAFNYLIEDFDVTPLGFVKLTNFLRYILKDSNLKLVLKEPSEYRIVFKNVNLNDFIDIDYLNEKPKIHTKEFYLKILSYRTPIIRIPENIENLHKVINFFIEHKNDYQNSSFQDIDDDLVNLGIEAGEGAKIINFLIFTNNLLGDNNSLPVKEQFYYFSPSSLNEVSQNISTAIEQKILKSLDGTIDLDELNKILKSINLATI